MGRVANPVRYMCGAAQRMYTSSLDNAHIELSGWTSWVYHGGSDLELSWTDIEWVGGDK